jgi:hypothetical protein
MRYSASEKLEIIRTVEDSSLGRLLCPTWADGIQLTQLVQNTWEACLPVLLTKPRR